MQAVSFFELLDREVLAVATAARGGEDIDADEAESVIPQRLRAANTTNVDAVMAASRQRLSRGVDTFVRNLPAAVRNDAGMARTAAYALVGLADEKMLHYPAGGLETWRDRLLEVELYGSALAGQEIIRQAADSAQSVGEAGQAGTPALLAPLYLALLREGFEGSLRGDALGLSVLTTTLEETVGAVRMLPGNMVLDAGPSRIGVPPAPLAIAGFALWLLGGLLLWIVLAAGDLEDAERMADRVGSGLPALQRQSTRPLGPSRPATPGATSSSPSSPPGLPVGAGQ